MTESGGVRAAGAKNPAGRRNRRRHPALGARILTTGLSATAMFWIVAALVAEDRSATVVAESSVPVSEPSLTLVDNSPRPAPDPTDASELSGQPVQLSANPVVRPAQATEAPAPIARTNGSR